MYRPARVSKTRANTCMYAPRLPTGRQVERGRCITRHVRHVCTWSACPPVVHSATRRQLGAALFRLRLPRWAARAPPPLVNAAPFSCILAWAPCRQQPMTRQRMSSTGPTPFPSSSSLSGERQQRPWPLGDQPTNGGWRGQEWGKSCKLKLIGLVLFCVQMWCMVIATQRLKKLTAASSGAGGKLTGQACSAWVPSVGGTLP